MLVGCFAAVATSYATGSALLGVLVAVLAGALYSMILGYGSVTRRSDPIVLAIAMNILAVGLTSFLLVAIFNVQGVLRDDRIAGLKPLPIPLLSDIPWIGRALFSMSWIGYLAIILVPVSYTHLDVYKRQVSASRTPCSGPSPSSASRWRWPSPSAPA